MNHIECTGCGRSDYQEHPGPYFLIPCRGWFCGLDCWKSHIIKYPDVCAVCNLETCPVTGKSHNYFFGQS